MNYHIFIDGGSRGNGTSNQEGYGSSQTQTLELDVVKKRPIKRYTFGNVTGNQAEYLVLIQTLTNVATACHMQFLKPGDVVRIMSDSALVVNQVNGSWKVKDPELQKLVTEAKELVHTIRQFIELTIGKVDRCDIVEALGH